MRASDWRRDIRWPGAPDRGPAPRTGASPSVDGCARTAEAGPRDPGVPAKSRWWGADFVGWDGVPGRRRSVGNSESIISGVGAGGRHQTSDPVAVVLRQPDRAVRTDRD